MFHQAVDRKVQSSGQHDLPLPDLFARFDQFRCSRIDSRFQNFFKEFFRKITQAIL
jgi:hypothetical protein